jgi:hypothetical protein
MRRSAIAFSMMLMVAAIAIAPNAAHAQWEIYDNFSSGFINPERWRGFEVAGGVASPNTEIARHVALGVLHEKLVGYGAAGSDSGSVSHTTGLQVTDPASIIGIEAKVAVLSATANGCAGNSISARARAQVIGAFFNDGSSSAPGDRTGDILAGIQKQLDSFSGKEIVAFITQCADPGCTSTTTLKSHVFTTWNFFLPHVLRVEWDAFNDQFIFTINPGGPGQESHTLSYVGTDDSDTPGLAFKQVSINLTTPNCQDDQLKTAIDAVFDRVSVLPGV